jgi:hypothetical protein
VRLDKGGVDVDQDVGPDFTDVVHLILGLDGGVGVRIDCFAGRIRVGADAGSVTGYSCQLLQSWYIATSMQAQDSLRDVLAHDIVPDGRRGLLGPEGDSIGPALTHAARLSRLKTSTRSAT